MPSRVFMKLKVNAKRISLLFLYFTFVYLYKFQTFLLFFLSERMVFIHIVHSSGIWPKIEFKVGRKIAQALSGLTLSGTPQPEVGTTPPTPEGEVLHRRTRLVYTPGVWVHHIKRLIYWKLVLNERAFLTFFSRPIVINPDQTVFLSSNCCLLDFSDSICRVTS